MPSFSLEVLLKFDPTVSEAITTLLDYFIQRPESHSYHHERGVHARNYGDLPVFDMIFGTFHNPREFVGEVGFFEGSSRKVGPMLIGKVIA